MTRFLVVLLYDGWTPPPGSDRGEEAPYRSPALGFSEGPNRYGGVPLTTLVRNAAHKLASWGEFCAFKSAVFSLLSLGIQSAFRTHRLRYRATVSIVRQERRRNIIRDTPLGLAFKNWYTRISLSSSPCRSKQHHHFECDLECA